MKKRILSLVICLLLCVTVMPFTAIADAPSNTSTLSDVRMLDGSITKGDLYKAFGGNTSSKKIDYRYCVMDVTGWKRIDQNDSSSTQKAENTAYEDKVYTLQKATYNSSISSSRSWLTVGTFKFVTYYNIAVSTQGDVPDGCSVTANGGTADKTYEINKNDTLTLHFTTTDDYDFQVKTGTGAWITVTGGSYVHTAECSTVLSVRFAEKTPGKNRLSIRVINASFGEYSGIDTDYVETGKQITLKVKPYNSSTTPENDKWAYVKSVKVNGTELDGTYSQTVFSGKFTVTADTDIVIEFAERLVFKTPDVMAQKYSGDPKTAMYSARMDTGKSATSQVDLIKQSIIDSVVDTENTPEYQKYTFYLKTIISLGFMQVETYTAFSDTSLSFHTDGEEWEEVQLELAAVGERYPKVRTEDITVWILKNIEISGVEAQNGNYNGLAQKGYSGTLTANNGYTGGFETHYSGRNGTVYNSDKAPTNAGDYTVTITTEKSDTVNGGYKSLDFTVSKANVTVTADNCDKIYGETDPEYTFKITDGTLYGDDKLVGITAVRVNGEDVNNYDITLSEPKDANPNYNVTLKKGVFKINQRTVGIDWANTEFTYDGGLKTPLAIATNTVYGDEISLTVTGGKINAGQNYTATVTEITGDKSGNYRLPQNATKTFSINKATQSKPVNIVGVPEDVDGRANGEIQGVNDKMEYRVENDTDYTDVDGTKIIGLADGTYYVRYKETENYLPSDDCTVELSGNRKLTVTLPETQTGYTITADKSELAWGENVTVTFVLNDGYSKCNDFAVKINGEPVTLTDGKYVYKNARRNVTVTVEGVGDITSPDLEINLGENVWNKFTNDLKDNLYFAAKQQITVSAQDNGSGLDKIYYYLSQKLLTQDEITNLDNDKWIVYTESFYIDNDGEYIIYVKAVDKDGNITLVNSESEIVIDTESPVVTGLENGKTYAGDVTFAVSDKNLDAVTVDGKNVILENGKYTIAADGKQHTVKVTDKTGENVTEITVTVNVLTVPDNKEENNETGNALNDDNANGETTPSDSVDNKLDGNSDVNDFDMPQNTDVTSTSPKTESRFDFSAYMLVLALTFALMGSYFKIKSKKVE